jgi:hypothetical protein
MNAAFRFKRWAQCSATIEAGFKMCYTKAAYKTKEFAQGIVEKRSRKSEVQLRIYECPNCKMFHITKAGL